MTAWNTLYDIEAWNLARKVCQRVDTLTKRPCYRQDPGLRRQMLNSSGSMMDNVAEGFGRGSNAEFKTFVGYSKGSAEELHSQLIRSSDKGFISNNELEAIKSDVLLFGKLCGGIIKSIRQRKDERGFRFQEDLTPYGYSATPPC